MSSSTARSRRRVIISSPDVVEVVTEDVPEIGPEEALVSMLVSGVCGSDTHAMHGHHPAMKLPYYPGHEVVGIVEAVGSNVTDLSVGTRVTPEPTLPCGHCKMCHTNRENVCENLEFFGCGFREGGMTDLFTVRADRLHVVPEDMSDLAAALIEPLATPVHAVRLAGDIEGKTVVILGAGTIALLLLATAKYRGARTIVMTDVLESKRDLALKLGADAVVDAADPDVAALVTAELDETADFVFDCVSIQPTFDSAVDMIGKGGTIVIVGIPRKPILVPMATLQDRQNRIQGAATYIAEDYADAIEIIRSGGVSVEDIISSTYPMTEAQDAFMASAGGREVKVIITA
ncbi:MAG: alcohol dehydrogenase [Microbacteriaceae bacterium]|nr:alcohol dehydrogenase [Microbacteriaceae bacterium]